MAGLSRHRHSVRSAVRSHPWRAGGGGFAVVAISLLAYSITGALIGPGTDGVSARLAEWARGHGGSPVVNLAERLTYRAPKAGGQPQPGALLGGSPADVTISNGPAASRIVPLPPPASIVPIASPAVADEGAWRVLATAAGLPVLQAAFLRADPLYTSYTTAVAWMDTRLLAFELHPGTSEPGGGPWPLRSSLPTSDRRGVVAAFNSAFRVRDARGGFYEAGRSVGTLRDGAASVVIDDHGVASVGEWGRDVTMSPSVVAVRQNLDLVVDGGQVSPLINDNTGGRWGSTVGNQLYVWRSGVGVTATGALIYAVGPRLSASTLAQVLVRAGAVRAMELDINATWTTFIHYGAGADPTAGTKLLPTMVRPTSVYDSTSSRDFIVARER